MDVSKVFINTYRYDAHFAKICVASIRYWYPDVTIYLIKDESSGPVDTKVVERIWDVNVLPTEKKKFGWGYGKLEVLFLNDNQSFLVIDADTVITGPIIDHVKNIQANFIVDREEQPPKRFNEIYYNLSRINEIDSNFKYPGYSFNTGQWFGTSSIIRRDDFNPSLEWSNPPVSKNKSIIVNNDQGHLNFVIHSMEQRQKLSVARIKLMVWPENGKADFIQLDKIREHQPIYPFVVHWAGMSAKRISELPRADLLKFYRRYYYSKAGTLRFITDNFRSLFLAVERKIKFRLGRSKRRSQNQ